MTLEWDLPNIHTPGFLRRRRDLLTLLGAEGTPENLDKLAMHLVQYVKGPITHDQALVEIMDMDLAEYGRVISALLTNDLDQVPPPLGGRSGTP